MDPVSTIRGFYLLCSALMLAANVSPLARTVLFTYGSRSMKPSNRGQARAAERSTQPKKHLEQTLDRFVDAASVPHSWFLHFYVVSVLWSAFWAFQLFLNGKAYQLIVSYAPDDSRNSMSLQQVVLLLILMTAQGSRRLYETATLFKNSGSPMRVWTWLVGIAFYTATGMAVWVEGIPALREGSLNFHLLDPLQVPSLRTFCFLPLFMISSGVQHDFHVNLASLKKYSLPTHPLFNILICPHYFAEVMVYLSLAVLAAPEGEWVNKTLFCTLIFTVIALSGAADTSKEWYWRKFGDEAVRGKQRIIPYVY